MNPFTSFRIVRGGGDLIRFEASLPPEARGRGEPGLLPVVSGAIDYMQHLARISDRRWLREGRPIIVQCDDTPIDVDSVGWENGRDWSATRLIPDLYYFRERGYQDQLHEVPTWRVRRDVVGWRGATTGKPQLTCSDLDQLPRYRLVKLASELGSAADVGFSKIVQARDEDQHHLIERRLMSEGLLRPYVPFSEFRSLRYIVDIGGNANAWNFMHKLRLGACVLRVACDWHQWFESRLIAWEHYIPVAQDLSDFAERLEWCRSNASEAEKIAMAGRHFALSMRFEDEMRGAAATVFGNSGN